MSAIKYNGRIHKDMTGIYVTADSVTWSDAVTGSQRGGNIISVRSSFSDVDG